MKRNLVLALVCVLLLSGIASSQTRRHRTVKRKARPSTSYAEKEAAEIRAGRERIAAQIKILTQFLYLYAGVSKGIEAAEYANKNHEQSSIALPPDQIDRNKVRIRESVRSLRLGLAQLEASFRTNPALQSYYPKLAGAAGLGEAAERQAAASSFEEAGKSLLTAANKLTDALVAVP